MSTDKIADSYADQDSTQISFKATLLRLLRYVLKYPIATSLGLVFILVGTLSSLCEPWFFGKIIDSVLVPGRRELLAEYTAIFFSIVFVRVMTTILQSYTFERVGQSVMQDLRLELISCLQAQPMSVFDRTPIGRLVTRVANDVPALAEMFAAGFALVAGNFLIVFGSVVWLLFLNLKLGLISLAVMIPMVIGGHFLSNRLKRAYREARSRLSNLNAYLAENILGIRVVMLFNRQAIHQARYQSINERYSESQMDTIRTYAYLQPLITMASAISITLLIYAGGIEVAEKRIPIGVLVAFFSYLLAMFQPIREMADKWNIFLSGLASAERIFSILDWPTEMPVKMDPLKDPASIAPIRGEIIFENVWFAYKDEHWVLKDFSLTIRAGSRMGVVGHTGAGKTTLMSLLMRFYEPTRGRILLDGKDIREWDKRELRSRIGIIQQDVFLFSGSLEDNIKLFRDKARPSLDLLTPSMRARLSEPLDERGGNLSSGERQVIAFSRAQAGDPAIWILDEATANVDSETEARLSAELARSSYRKTTLMIAHRLATVRTCDQILVLHKGVLVESGNHKELIKKNGLYARMYRYQEALKEVQA